MATENNVQRMARFGSQWGLPPVELKRHSTRLIFLLVTFGGLATTFPLHGQLSDSATTIQTNSTLSGHLLRQFLITNQIGTYSLPYHWAGQEKITAVTGYYAIKGDAPSHTNDYLYFDSLRVGSTNGKSLFNCTLFKSPIHSSPAARYCDALPADDELLKLRSHAAVTNFLGWNPFSNSEKYPGAEAFGVRYFTLRPDNALETLRVTFRRSAESNTIEGILIKRAYLQPAAIKP